MKIVVLTGDGIGPEISAVALRALGALDNRFGLGLEVVPLTIGLAALERSGSTVPEAVAEEARAADGLVLAPCSTYEYPAADAGGINPSAYFRKTLDLYANMRPAKTLSGVPCLGRPMDLVVARENTEGFYADRSMYRGSGEMLITEDVAISIRKVTRAGCERIARAAFELARRRRKQVTMVHKANVLTVSDGLFVESVQSIAREFPDVGLDESIVDAMTARLIRNPEAFDVICTTNMFGDILSDEAAELSGGLGLGGALNHGDRFAMAQAAHGSAPDIAGRNTANPSALILSVAMLLDWMGSKHGHNSLGEASAVLRDSVEALLAIPENHTEDLGGNATTSSFGDALVGRLSG